MIWGCGEQTKRDLEHSGILDHLSLHPVSCCKTAAHQGQTSPEKTQMELQRRAAQHNHRNPSKSEAERLRVSQSSEADVALRPNTEVSAA